MRTTKGNQRGALAFAVAGILVVMLSMCGLVLSRSFECYRASAEAAHQFQLLAAAEGAAALRVASGLADPAPEAVVMGKATVSVSPMESVESEGRRELLSVRLRGAGEQFIRESVYSVLYTPTASGSWQIAELTGQ